MMGLSFLLLLIGILLIYSGFKGSNPIDQVKAIFNG